MQYPYATDIKPDWQAQRIAGKWYSVGTSLGEVHYNPHVNRHYAVRQAQRMNEIAWEGLWENWKIAVARGERLAKLKAARKGKSALQTTFAF